MAKISMKVGNTNETANRTMKGIRREKTKVKKFSNAMWGPQIEDVYSSFENCTMMEKKAMTEALKSFGVNMDADDFMRAWFDRTGDVLDEWEDDDYMETEKSKTEKSVRDPTVLLKKGWVGTKRVNKGDDEEETPDKDAENSEVPPDKDADSDAGQSDTEEEEVEVDEDVEKAKKSAKKDPYKAMHDLMKAKGWVFKAKDDDDEEPEEKADDQGPDSEDVEDGALEEDAVVDVPDTPEPSDDVGDTATGMPEEPPLPESEDNDTPTEEDGNDMDVLLPKTINNIDIDLDDADDDLDEMIDKKRMEKDNDISLSSIGGMQPFKNNYRTTQMGEGKMDALSQMQVKVGKK